MQKQNNPIQDISSQLMILSINFKEVPVKNFNYKERILIERPLFLILKEVCIMFNYQLHGLSNKHKSNLFKHIQKNKINKNLLHFANMVFDIKVFITALSSSNPYIKGDVLSYVDANQKEVMNFLSHKIKRIADESLQLVKH